MPKTLDDLKVNIEREIRNIKPDELTLTTQPHQKIRFLEIFFRILNMFAIVSNLRKKMYFCQNHL